MKPSFLTSLLLILALSAGCDFEMNTGPEKKDPIPESTLLTNGLNSDPVAMTVDGEPSTDNTFTFGNTVNFDFNNVIGLKQIKGLTYPGMSMHVTNVANDSTIYFRYDLFEDSKGTDLSPLLLNAKFKTSLPHLNNEKYNIELKIWDKKGSGKMSFNLPFTVKASDVLSIENNGLKYSNIYFWDETAKEVVLDKTVDNGHEFIVINEGLKGFDIVDGMSYAGISLLVVDNNGKELVSSENLVSEFSETGIDPIELRDNQAPVTISFTEGKLANPCRITCKIYDLKNPEKYITIKTDLVLE